MQENDAYAIKLHNLYAGGLIAISLIILQDFLNVRSLDTPAFIAVLLFSIALPFLSGVIVLDVVEQRFTLGPARALTSKVVHIAFFLSIVTDLGAIAAAIWHASWICGVVFLGSLLAALAVYGIYIINLDDKDQTNDPTTSRKGA